MTKMDEPASFSVTYHEPGDESGLPAGVLSIGADQHITIVSTEPKFASRLELAADSLNKSESFMIRAKPPADAEPLSLHKRRVLRGSADARSAVIELLRKQYGLSLTAVGEKN
jgi:hypothetical protein